MNVKRHIPNLLTLGNLFCGCLAIVEALRGDLVGTAILVGIAAVCDFLDGMAARFFRVVSAIGKDLDSLADMVTFGVVPGIVMFQLFNLTQVLQSVDDQVAAFGYSFEDLWSGYHSASFISYTGFLVTLFSCLRLAKFNNDVRQTDSFIGLPTPANTIFICSLPLLLHFYGDRAMFILNVFSLVVLCVVSSGLLVAEFRLFSLKFKSLRWRGNRLRYTLVIVSLVLLTGCGYAGIPLSILAYLLISFVNNIFSKQEV